MTRIRSVVWLGLALSAVWGCSSSAPPIAVSVSPAQQTLDVGQTVSITAMVMSDPSFSGVSWNLVGPGSLSNSTSSGVTYLAPVNGLTTTQQAMVTATSIKDGTKSAALKLTLNPYPAIPFQSLPNAVVGQPYSQTIAMTGGSAPFQWSIYNGPIITGFGVGGSLPDGLTLNASNGTITGTPTGAGTWVFEATLTDAGGATAVNGALSIQVTGNAAAGNPVPLLNQTLTPTAVAPGSNDFTLNVNGAGFVSGAKIAWNGAPLATTFVDAEHLTATVPAANVATAGTGSITVVNPGPGGGASNVVYLPVAAPAAAVHFANAPNSPLTFPEVFNLTVADLNGDGKPDLAISANARLYVLLGKGDGTFSPTPQSPIEDLSPPYDDAASPYGGPLVAGDFNHSGHLGLVLGEFQNEAAFILLGHGDGTLNPSSATFADSLGNSAVAINAADFNADGNLDLAILNETNGQAPVLLGYGDGAFSAAGDLTKNGLPTGMAVGDFNGDGKLDVAVASAGLTTAPFSAVIISFGNGDGTFNTPNAGTINVGTSLTGIVAADFNGDGKLDLAVTDGSGNAVFILLGNGDGRFGPPTKIPLGNQPVAIVAGDFNNDGKQDLAVANSVDGTITLLLGNGDGTFTATAPYPVGLQPVSLAAADFNGDGKLDLAVVNLDDGTVSILLQQ